MTTMLAVFSIGLILFSLFHELIPQIELASHSHTTTATVTGYGTYRVTGKTACSTGVAYRPGVRFTTFDGDAATARLGWAASSSRPASPASATCGGSAHDVLGVGPRSAAHARGGLPGLRTPVARVAVMGDERVTRVRQSWAAVDAAAPQVLVRNLPAKGTVDLDSPFFPRSRLACPACAAG